jgi:hypothetical protein
MIPAEKRYLVIAGQAKAGTTSLFDWLSAHPDICPSRFKEARFFLDEGYPLVRPAQFDGTNLDAYLDLFDCPDRPVLMEASPDYLACATPLEIAHLLPRARIVILVRPALERLQSAYGFFKQRGLLARDLGFDDWIRLQAETPVAADTPVALRALDHCRPHYLECWRTAFGDRLLEVDFADLRRDPEAILARVVAHAGLDPSPNVTQDLSPSNPTRTARSAAAARLYHRFRTQMSHLVGNRKGLRAALAPMSRLMRRAVEAGGKPDKVEVGPETLELIARITSDRAVG